MLHSDYAFKKGGNVIRSVFLISSIVNIYSYQLNIHTDCVGAILVMIVWYLDYNYLCNQCLSPLKLWDRISVRRGVLDTTSRDKVCQLLPTGRWCFLGTPVYSTNKTDRHHITEILLKAVLNSINQTKPTYRLYQLYLNYIWNVKDKKIAPNGGKRENLWGISCEKSRFYADMMPPVSKFVKFHLVGITAID